MIRQVANIVYMTIAPPFKGLVCFWKSNAVRRYLIQEQFRCAQLTVQHNVLFTLGIDAINAYLRKVSNLIIEKKQQGRLAKCGNIILPDQAEQVILTILSIDFR